LIAIVKCTYRNNLIKIVFVCTIMFVKIIFDPTKDAVNIAKHGVSMALADQFEWDAAVIWIDDRKDYGEPRMCGLVPLDERLFFVAFVDRADGRRVISLRKANNREKRHYAKVFDD